jgi:hypothetical protein
MDNNKKMHGHNEPVENDQLRENTMNETIREVSGDADADINTLGSSNQTRVGGLATGSDDLHGSDLTQGMSYMPNDTSGVRSGGISDMDDQQAGGAGLSGHRSGSGAGLTEKSGMSGSDFDGQNATS